MATSASAQDQFLGQLMPMGNNYCPKGWIEANGQLLSIAQNAALFSLFGVTYGGDGVTTFGLPDLRGRVSQGQGQGPGLPMATQGAAVGAPSTTLTTANLPPHIHMVLATSSAPDVGAPSGAALATFAAGQRIYTPTVQPTPMGPGSISPAGGNQPVSEYQPSLVLRYCVALVGIFPSRN